MDVFRKHSSRGYVSQSLYFMSQTIFYMNVPAYIDLGNMVGIERVSFFLTDNLEKAECNLGKVVQWQMDTAACCAAVSCETDSLS